MDESWIKRPVWGPAYENGELELPETTLEHASYRAMSRSWYVIACGSNDGDLELLDDSGLTLDEAREVASR